MPRYALRAGGGHSSEAEPGEHGRPGGLRSGPLHLRLVSAAQSSPGAASLSVLLGELPASRRDDEPTAEPTVVPQVRQEHQAGLLQHWGYDLRGYLLRGGRACLLYSGGLPPPAALGRALRDLPAPLQALPGPARPLLARRPAGHRDAHRAGDAAGSGVVRQLRGGCDGPPGAGEDDHTAGDRSRGSARLLPLPVLERHRDAGGPGTRLRGRRGRAGLFPRCVGESVDRQSSWAHPLKDPVCVDATVVSTGSSGCTHPSTQPQRSGSETRKHTVVDTVK